jgi:hypothetical protein
MRLKELLRREMYVVVHGQTARFRIVKWIVILAAGSLLFAWIGPALTGKLFVVLAVFGILIHFLFRFKTKGWTRPWGPYKRVLLDDDGYED